MPDLLNTKIIKNFIIGKFFFKPAPIWIDFRITGRCNLRCEYCNIPNQKYNEMTLKEVKTVIDKIKNTGCSVLLTGGEPLLRADIKEIIDYIRTTTNMGVSLNSNLTLLKNKYDLVKDVDFFYFSLDGNKETHNKMKGPKSFERMIEGLEILSKHKKTAISMTVITKFTTIEDIKEVFALSKKYNFIPGFQLVTHYEFSNKSSDIEVDKKKIEKIIEYIIEQKKKGTIIMNTTKNLIAEKALISKNLKLNCYSGRLFCYISSEGDVGLCFARPYNKKYINIARTDATFKDALKRLEEIKPCKDRCKRCSCMASIEFSIVNLFDVKTLSELHKNFSILMKKQNKKQEQKK